MDPQIVRLATQNALGTLFSLGSAEAKGAWRRKTDRQAAEARTTWANDEAVVTRARGTYAEDVDPRIAEMIARGENGDGRSGGSTSDEGVEGSGEAREAGAAAAAAAGPKPLVIPDDWAASVIGLDREKRVIRHAIETSHVAGDRVHVLMIGPPGSGKTVLLDECARIKGSTYVGARTMTPAGLIGRFVDTDDPPQLLLIDEIEKCPRDNTSKLLEICDQKATRMNSRSQVNQPITVRVIAACNSTDGMDEALLTRFHKLYLKPVPPDVRAKGMAEFLVSRHHISKPIAEKVAKAVVAKNGVSRDAVRIAGAWQSDESVAKDMLDAL